MTKSEPSSEIYFPDFPHLIYPRTELLRMSTEELYEALPQKKVMSSDQSNWQMWEEITKSTAMLGNLDFTWIDTTALELPIKSWLHQQKSRLALIMQPIVISGPPQCVFDEIYCELDIYSVTAKNKRLSMLPTIKELMPISKWHTVLSWGSRLSLNINSQSQLTISPSQSLLLAGEQAKELIVSEQILKELVPALSLQTSQVASEDASAHLIVKPFEYIVRRPLIKSDGIGSNKARFYFGRGPMTKKSSGMLEDSQLTVASIVIVPEKSCLEIHTKLAARHHLDAKIPNFASLIDTLQLASSVVRDFILGGAPLVDEKINGYPVTQGSPPIC